MYWLRFFLPSSAVFTWMVLAMPTILAATNTNQCIKDLGGILACQDRNAIGFPNDIQVCCDGVRQLAQDSCHCNPAVDTVLGEEGTKIYDLEAICRVVQPTKWLKVTPMFLRKCESVASHDYGCERSDIEVDGERLETIFSFQDAFKNSADEKTCLDTPVFTAHLDTLFTPDIKFIVPYGVGTYEGTQNVAEYLGMDFNGLTHGYWKNNTTPDPTKRARLDVTGDGSTWALGFTSKGEFLRGTFPYHDAYLEQEIKFEGCNTRASSYSLIPTEGMRLLAERFVQTADLSKRWGVDDICRYHTNFCAGDPETRQYESEEECREYVGNLPLYSEACGPNRALAGNSLSCKFKHHFMIPANPKLHCAHIGRNGSMDVNDHLKCDDATECSQDLGQDSWPPISEVGDKTPANVKKAFEESNLNFLSEPFGCAVPSLNAGHHH